MDIDYLGQFRRDLVKGELQLFTVTWTVSVALASAYFALCYYGVTTGQYASANQSFWRMMLGSLPGVLAFVAIFLMIQREIMIHKVDTFVAVLKELHVNGLHPRQYRGWETAYRQYTHVFGTTRCRECKAPKKCGDLTHDDKLSLNSLRPARDPNLDPYHVLLYGSYALLVALSFALMASEFVTFQSGVLISMVIIPSVVLILVGGAAVGYRYLWQLRKGRYSFLQLRRAWLDLLLHCRQIV